jgi:hypothetical protein
MKLIPASWPLRLAVVVLLVISLLAGLPTVSNIKSPATKQCQMVMQIRMNLLMYADDHEGKLPARLFDLSPTYLQGDQWQFRDPDTRKMSEWIYYPGHTMHDPPDTILAASPVPVIEEVWPYRHIRYRVITTIGTSYRLVREADFQRGLGSLQSRD